VVLFTMSMVAMGVPWVFKPQHSLSVMVCTVKDPEPHHGTRNLATYFMPACNRRHIKLAWRSVSVATTRKRLPCKSEAS
jgi:hypothetical protein